MIERRPFGTLGGADHGWLKARHHFSFARYYDAQRMGWGALRVWNDDEIAPKSGFPSHPHADMEIITYVREGAITHEDDLGNKGRTPHAMAVSLYGRPSRFPRAIVADIL
jgi:quercetin 2,3-dioxygenase